MAQGAKTASLSPSRPMILARRLARRFLPLQTRAAIRRFSPLFRRPVNFRQAYLEYMGIQDGQPMTPLQETYVDFALSANDRGAFGAGLISEAIDVRGKRCLDIGCAYGGHLVALANSGAGELVGIDINEGLLKLAKVNLEENMVAATLRKMDILDDPRAAGLGKFDIIVCNDVLEHVIDLPSAIRNIAGLVSNGGVLFLVTPNKYFVRYLLKDSHYQIPGITLISHHQAERYCEAVTGGGYDVGYYRTLGYFLNVFREQAIDLRLLKTNWGVYDLDQLEREFQDVRSFYSTFSRPEISPALQRKVKQRAEVVCRNFFDLMGRYRQALRDGAPEVDSLAEKLLVRFGMESWTMIGTCRRS